MDFLTIPGAASMRRKQIGLVYLSTHMLNFLFASAIRITQITKMQTCRELKFNDN